MLFIYFFYAYLKKNKKTETVKEDLFSSASAPLTFGWTRACTQRDRCPTTKKLKAYTRRQRWNFCSYLFKDRLRKPNICKRYLSPPKLSWKWFLSHFQLLFCSIVCFSVLSPVRSCQVLKSWFRELRPQLEKQLSALLSLAVTPDGPTDGLSDVLLVHRLSRQPARHASVSRLSRSKSQN